MAKAERDNAMSTIYITHIRLSGGESYEHIVRFWTLDGPEEGYSLSQMITRVFSARLFGKEVRTWPGRYGAIVERVNAGTSKEYLRTDANCSTSDNLLSLPKR